MKNRRFSFPTTDTVVTALMLGAVALTLIGFAAWQGVQAVMA